MTDQRLIKLVASRVQELRKARNLTQEQMQDYGLNYRYYQRIEAGEKNLSLRTLNKLAKAFGIEPGDLLRFD
jgi:transcriptional regulator with XRE-family HTH domain